MNYTFFGCCYKDHQLAKIAIKSISEQKCLPSQLIIVDSGCSTSFHSYILSIFPPSTEIIYIPRILPRVDALNLAIDQITTDFALRFDSRSRFAPDYALNALHHLSTRHLVGGVPIAVPEVPTWHAYLVAGLFNRSYVFGNPLHRRIGFTGESESVYLGAFRASCLKLLPYRKCPVVNSEDSQISADFKKLAWNPFISADLHVYYASRASLVNVFQLFFSYGTCRAANIVYFSSFHRPWLLILVLFLFISLTLISLISPLLSLGVLLLLPVIYNTISEMLFKSSDPLHNRILYPILAAFSQYAWLAGLLAGFISPRTLSTSPTNFIR